MLATFRESRFSGLGTQNTDWNGHFRWLAEIKQFKLTFHMANNANRTPTDTATPFMRFTPTEDQ